MKIESLDGAILSGRKQDAVDAPFDLAERRSRSTVSSLPARAGSGCCAGNTVEAQADVRAGDILHIGVAPRQADAEAS